MTCWKTTLVQRDRARAVRTDMSEAETRLWSVLRKRVTGPRFRRQAPVGPYIVDFLSHDGRLIVELDTAGPADAPQMRTDLARTAFLQALGFRMIRFCNEDVLFNLEGVVDALLTCSADGPVLQTRALPHVPSHGSEGTPGAGPADTIGETDARSARRPNDPARWPVERRV